MNLHELFFGTMPAVSIIYKDLGFVPTEDEICEISSEEYAAYEKQGGDISKRLYTVIPKEGKVLMPDNVVGLFTEADIPRIMKAANILRRYAIDGGCDSDNSDDILATAALRLPSVFTEGTKYARRKKEDAGL